MEFSIYTIAKKHFFSRTYHIYRNDEHLQYAARRSFFSKEFFLYDVNGEVIYRVKRNFAIFKWSFTIFYKEEVFAQIRSKGGFKTRLNVATSSGDYHIEGKILNRDFTIFRDIEQVAKVSRTLSMNSRMGIAIKEGEDDAFIIALVLLIELIVKVKNARKG